MHHLRTFLLCTFIISTIAVAGQGDLSPYLDSLKSNTELNFYDYQKAVDKYLSERSNRQVKGLKQYRRWEWFWDARLYPHGNFPDAFHSYNEWLKMDKSFHEVKATDQNADWVSYSPATVPGSSDELQTTGMGRINCLEFHPTDTNTLWIGSSSGGVWKTMDNGQNWICITDNLPIQRISAIEVDPLAPDTMYIATGDIEYFKLSSLANGFNSQYGIGVFKTHNGGVTWEPTGLNFQLWDEASSLIRGIKINPNNRNELIAVGIGGIFKSSDAGDNWVKIIDQAFIDFDMANDSASTLYATGVYIELTNSINQILKSEDFGTSWDTLATSIPAQNEVLRTEMCIAPSDSSILYALTCSNNRGFYALYKSIDAGIGWTVVAAKDTIGITASAKAPNILGWSDGGYFENPLLPSDEGGQGTYDLTLAIDPIDPNKIYTGGINMWGSEDGGLSWSFISYWQTNFGSSLHADQHYSSFHPLSGDFFQANDGGLSKTENIRIGNIDTVINCINLFTLELEQNCYELPTVWQNLSNGIHITEYYRLGLSKSEVDMVSGGSQDNGTYLLRNGLWLNIFGGDGMETIIHPENPDIIYVTTQNGSLHKTIDGGTTFSSGLEAEIDGSGENSEWVTPFVMDPVDYETIYAGYQNIWKSTNGGSNWEKISNWGLGTATIKTIEVAPDNPDVIYCSKKGYLFRTVDAGITWTNISAGLPLDSVIVLSIAVADTLESKLWVSCSGFSADKKIFVSEDYGDTWENISGLLPNVSMNSIIYQKETLGSVTNAIYVGSDLGVFYSNDSIQATNNKWIAFNEGMPAVPVNELEVHYGNQKLYAASYGRGLWKGNLFSPSQVENIEAVQNYDFSISIYPNPITDKVTLDLYLRGTQEAFIEIYDSSGRLKYREAKDVNRHLLHAISLNTLAPGTYMLKVVLEDSHITKRIIKL